MTLVLTLGNTHLRHALADGDSLVHHGVIPLDGRSLPSLDLPIPPGVDDAVIASVYPEGFAEVEALLARRGLGVHACGRDFEVPIANHYRSPGSVGIDRLLAVYRARQLFPGEGLVVIDFGTALTFNVASPAGEFLGGLIGIGASTAAAALGEWTPRLPRVKLEAPDELIARDTESAVRNGIFLQMKTSVEAIVESLKAECPWPLRVIATGGDAELFATEIPVIERVEPELVLEGLWASYQLSRSVT